MGERILGEALSSLPVSAGFHYPVRSQYSTLHLQLRVNSGNVCNLTECRGVDLLQLLSKLRTGPGSLQQDDELLHYQATANLRATLLAAVSSSAGAEVEEVGPMSLVLRALK